MFSAIRAMRHVRAIAQRPHPTGSAEHARVRAYIEGELRALGLEPEVQETVGIGTRYRAAGTVRNIVARIPGAGAGGSAVLLVAHHDSQGATPGAGDDAAGVATLLETARALHAGEPLARDVLLLFTDAEESGLLGAAAFVREHPRARDVGAILNFEARGTHGRAFMFETGAGNLGTARVLREAPDVSASSLMVLAYRVLPNDTDLSELSVLGVPAMNFALIDGVERYHTAYDDVTYLDPGSLQHMGAQALALTRAVGASALSNTESRDAVFFDAPLAGVIVYPAALALPVALLAVALVLAAVVRDRRKPQWWRGVSLGAGGAIAALVLAALFAGGLAVMILRVHAGMNWGGAPEWRGVYQAATNALAMATALAAWAIVRRRASPRAAFAGALLTWAAVTLAVTMLAPEASYLVTWPLLFAAGASLVSDAPARALGAGMAHALAVGVAMAVLLPVVVLLGTALGTTITGAAAAALLTALGGLLLAPALEWIAGERRWLVAGGAFAASLTALLYGMATVRPSLEYPTRENIEFSAASPAAGSLPRAVVLSDSATTTAREVTLRVQAPESTWFVRLGTDARVLATDVAGRTVDASRYRRRSGRWELEYFTPPDTGFVLALTVPAGDPLAIDLVAQRAGVPDSVRAARRRDPTRVPSHDGDVTVARAARTLLPQAPGQRVVQSRPGAAVP